MNKFVILFDLYNLRFEFMFELLVLVNLVWETNLNFSFLFFTLYFLFFNSIRLFRFKLFLLKSNLNLTSRRLKKRGSRSSKGFWRPIKVQKQGTFRKCLYPYEKLITLEHFRERIHFDSFILNQIKDTMILILKFWLVMVKLTFPFQKDLMYRHLKDLWLQVLEIKGSGHIVQDSTFRRPHCYLPKLYTKQLKFCDHDDTKIS